MLYWAIFKHYTSVLPDSGGGEVKCPVSDGCGGEERAGAKENSGAGHLRLRENPDHTTQVAFSTFLHAPPPWHPPRRDSLIQWLGTWFRSLTQAAYGEPLGTIFSLSVPWFPYPTWFIGLL